MSSVIRRGPIAVVLGTRPEIIKLAKITELLGDDVHLIHTGQHYDENLSEIFFNEFSMRAPDTYIGVGGGRRGEQIGRGVAALDELFSTLKPSAVVVQGDTNAVLAGALAANSNDLPLIHVEAGLRSYDREMPEEHNRVATDHLSDLCLAPTALNVENLKAEGVRGSRVIQTGNPVIEAVERLLPTSEERSDLLGVYGVAREGFVLATIHRPENTDDAEKLETILSALCSLTEPGLDVLLPLHPRTRERITKFGLEGATEGIRIVDPIGYRDFIGLGAESRLLVSDSGGIQEEVTVYKRPAVVIRRSTERQEVEGTFVRRYEPSPNLATQLADEVELACERAAILADVPSPYGEREAPQLCVDAIRGLIK